ncbi:hypothetical protein A7985_09035 [Pseudoalteromonas luteoviolacea]|uniref:HTH cro/C1-type domain-containing protein n=1 Tax=Pseudoalteromonas luteoviolacea TaxID=43657 RepID=A0A1C0TRR3_9GAMM|nr:helix-turn-helix transcriptional regulator [Pseudoalteromonas luteoviolacea]OCQ21943.1 hypothetical protein A7985_09035 [Pseudoalteromonas luteoviolacea]
MTKKKMTFEAIKKELIAKDIQFSDIAKAVDVTPSHVSNVARGSATSMHIAKAISLSLGKPLEHVFGEDYSHTKKRGPKDRTQRRNQIVEALQAGKPVPSPSMNL